MREPRSRGSLAARLAGHCWRRTGDGAQRTPSATSCSTVALPDDRGAGGGEHEAARRLRVSGCAKQRITCDVVEFRARRIIEAAMTATSSDHVRPNARSWWQRTVPTASRSCASVATGRLREERRVNYRARRAVGLPGPHRAPRGRRSGLAIEFVAEFFARAFAACSALTMAFLTSASRLASAARSCALR